MKTLNPKATGRLQTAICGVIPRNSLPKSDVAAPWIEDVGLEEPS